MPEWKSSNPTLTAQPRSVPKMAATSALTRSNIITQGRLGVNVGLVERTTQGQTADLQLAVGPSRKNSYRSSLQKRKQLRQCPSLLLVIHNMERVNVRLLGRIEASQEACQGENRPKSKPAASIDYMV